MKTLLYLASGPYRQLYEYLTFKKMYFVEKDDDMFGDSFQGISKKCRWMSLDALQSIDVLKNEGVTIDYLVSLNEGLDEGGGGYAILSDEVMGYLSPLLKDSFILICDFSHYSFDIRGYYASLDWGFEKVKELKETDKGYINPKVFTESSNFNSRNFGHVFLMRRIKKTTHLNIQQQQVKVTITHGSIWDDEAALDVIGISLDGKKIYGNPAYKSQSISDFFQSNPKVLNLKGICFEEVLSYCEQHNIKHLGLCPWLKGHYQEVVARLQNALPHTLESIRFYHLNKNDFKQLYIYSRF